MNRPAMTTERIDPLAVMEECEAYVDDAAEFPEQFKPGVVKRHQRQYREARAKVAELVEADREYDEARDDVRHAMGRGRSHLLPSARERHESAKARRAAALAAFGRQG